MQALILAGGAGTRLRSVLGDYLNKPMAPLAGRPFLEYLARFHHAAAASATLALAS